jgi:polysaccharide export outer membrane protein
MGNIMAFTPVRMEIRRLVVALAAVLSVFVAPALAQVERAATSPAQAVSSPVVEYRLGHGDRLRIIVFGEENLSGEYQIDATGRLALPLVGEVQLASLSVRQSERAIEDLLRGGYLNDPRVSIEVLNFRPFYILGEVQKPGEYPYTSGLTVFNAVATAGGFTPLANQHRALIKRAGSESEVEVPVTAATPIGPGDTLRVQKGAFTILGEVNTPGEYPFTEGMSVTDAVALARGFSYRANQSRVFIKRRGQSEERAFRVTPDLKVEAGDTLKVPERFF